MMADTKENEGKSSSVPEETPSGSKDMRKTLSDEALENFILGKRHMLVQDYTFAVQNLATACELYTEHFGEMALECAEVHFSYGKALLRLSQQQSGVLGGALNEEVTDEDDQEKSSGEDEQEKSGEDDQEKSSDAENVSKAETENPAEAENPTEASDDDKEPSESTDSPQTVVEAEAAKEPSEKDTTEADASEPGTSEQNESVPEVAQEEVEEDDLELAWNSLETAKSIYLRLGEDDSEAQLKIADILHLLAEISMESDNNQNAIRDLEASLEIKKRFLKPDDRLLAETYYQMGLAQLLEKMFTSALENFAITMKILELRKENLKNTPVPEEVFSIQKLHIDEELKDLDGILADIKEKVEDTKELLQDAKKALDKHMKPKPNETEEIGFANADKTENQSKPVAVTNISHLVKRKKPEQEPDQDRESKRLKLTENVQNGSTVIKE